MDERQADMVLHRYSYFGWTTIFVFFVLLGIWFGFNVRSQMSTATFYVWLSVCGLLALIGIVTWVYYLYLIIKNF